jgi:hypothetical protein
VEVEAAHLHGQAAQLHHRVRAGGKRQHVPLPTREHLGPAAGEGTDAERPAHVVHDERQLRHRAREAEHLR